MTVGGGQREVVAAPAPKNLAGALQASTPFSFFLANRAVAATGWPEKSNGSAVADPLAGERLRPCASAPPSSGFAAVLEPAREHPRRPGGETGGSYLCPVPESSGAGLSRRWRRWRTDQVSPAAPLSLGLGFGFTVLFDSRSNVSLSVLLIHDRIHFPYSIYALDRLLIPLIDALGPSSSRSEGLLTGS